MHEMHIVKDVFKDLLKHAAEHKAKKVTKIFLKMGEFTEINEDIVNFFFAEKSKNTIIEGAKIIIEKSLAREFRLVSFDVE